MEIALINYGKYLGVKGQNFAVYQEGELSQEFPFHKVKRAVIASGNNVSSSALFWLAQYGVETVIVSKTGKLVATIVSAYDDARADTRLMQYEAYFNRKGVEIAQAVARKRAESEISMMEKHGFNTSKLEKWLLRMDFEAERVDEIRVKIQALEGKCTQEYFKQYFKQFPDFLQPKKRSKFRAREPLNNLLNLGYEVLRRRVHVAVVSSHLDPYLGFLHATRMYRPALIYDMLEPWRTVAEEFILKHQETLSTNSFVKHGERWFLKREEQIRFTINLDKQIDKKRIPYNRRGNSKTVRIRTAIKEEPKKLAQYIRARA
jgi:CRISPR-associated protein Cas1